MNNNYLPLLPGDSPFLCRLMLVFFSVDTMYTVVIDSRIRQTPIRGSSRPVGRRQVYTPHSSKANQLGYCVCTMGVISVDTP